MALSNVTWSRLLSAIGNLSAADEIRDILEISQVLSSTEAGFIDGVTAGTVTASKALVVDANKDIGSLRHLTLTGSIINGNTDGATVKGVYYSGAISVTVPSITDPDIARVQVDVSALTFSPAVGDAVIAIPLVALPTNCRLQGAFVYATDGVEIVYGSEGGNVTGAAKNHGFLFFDLT